MCTSSVKLPFHSDVLTEEAGGFIFCFHNCRLFRNGEFVQVPPPYQAQLWVRDGKVLEPIKVFYEERRKPAIFVDCHGLILAPGFVDIQVNGAFGIDFTALAGGTAIDSNFHKNMLEEKAAQILHVAEKMLQFGVTSFCPTIITAPSATYKNFVYLLGHIEKDVEQLAGCILGAHFEGPFISHEKSGCHSKADIIEPSSLSSNINNAIDSVYGPDLSRVRIVTLAPELARADQLVAELCRRGCKVSIGHSNASLADTCRGIHAGAGCVTHLFNAMASFNHRNPGIIGALTDNGIEQQLYYGLITDGQHLARSAIQMAFRANPNGAIIITDCISALGLGNGTHQLGEQKVVVQGNSAHIEGSDILAGSVSSMPHCVKYFAECIAKIPEKNHQHADDVGLGEALRAATLNPAKFLGIADRKGTLRANSDADFVLLDEQLNVFATFLAGQKRFQNMEWSKFAPKNISEIDGIMLN